MAKYGEYSEIETAFLCRLCKPGATVVEVGANIGSHTVPLARHLTDRGRLFAFEPQPLLFSLLTANLDANHMPHVEAAELALGDSSAPLYLPELDYAAEGNFGGVALSTCPGFTEVRQIRLDDCIDVDVLHLIKIDVEGMEQAVLQGAAALLRQHRPLLYVENDREDNSSALIDHLLGLDYRLRWSTPPLFNPGNFLGQSENIFGETVSLNMLCIPAERYSGQMGSGEITAPDDRPWRHGPD
ncbi:MAG: FkbM family methyltransferase [Pseudomonadota bacterium]